MSSMKLSHSASVTLYVTGLFKSCRSLEILAGLGARFSLNSPDCVGVLELV